MAQKNNLIIDLDFEKIKYSLIFLKQFIKTYIIFIYNHQIKIIYIYLQ